MAFVGYKYLLNFCTGQPQKDVGLQPQGEACGMSWNVFGSRFLNGTTIFDKQIKLFLKWVLLKIEID